jgi:hypothetical protein
MATESEAPSVTVSPRAPFEVPKCGTVPPPSQPLPGSDAAIEDINKSFPGADADSREDVTADLIQKIPENRPKTRELLQEKSVLPKSLKRGWFGPEGWTLPETQGTVRLDVTKDGAIKKSREAGLGLRTYEGGERGTRTIFQQLPGKTVRIYKVIEEHQGESGTPTELQFRFEKGCKGGGLFSSEEERCSTSHCTGGHWWSKKNEKCTAEWRLLDKYSYLGHKGILLVDPNEPTDVIPEGKPIGFLTEPVARDANRKPVSIDLSVTGDTVDIRVQDPAEAEYPVVVDPQWFVGRWLARGALAVSGPNAQLALIAIGCAATGILTWPETVGQPWYRRVWVSALTCLQTL